MISETRQAELYEEALSKIDMSWLKPGVTCRLFFEKDNPHNRKLHIRAIIDDEQVVYKVWNKERWRWDYFVESLNTFRYRHQLNQYIDIEIEQ